MSNNEFIEWQEYYNEEPFLADRLEMQIAKVGYTNLYTGMSKVDIDFDYFLVSKHEKQEKKCDSKHLESQIMQIFGVRNGTDDR